MFFVIHPSYIKHIQQMIYRLLAIALISSLNIPQGYRNATPKTQTASGREMKFD